MSYDVFISFKNSGKDGKATPDATAARGVYDALKSAGMKVFSVKNLWRKWVKDSSENLLKRH